MLESLTKKHHIPPFWSFAWLEALGHDEAYRAYKRSHNRSPVVEVEEENGKKGIYQPHNISSRGGRIVGEILTPLAGNHSNILYINFGGTNSIATAVADFQTAPGGMSWKKHEARILKEINTHIANMQAQHPNQKVKIVISGHSLGGCYSQYAYQALQHALAKNAQDNVERGSAIESVLGDALAVSQKHRRHQLNHDRDIVNQINVHNVESLTIGVQNSPGVYRSIEDSSNALALPLRELGMKNRAYFISVTGDAVQTGGQGNILSDVDFEDNEVHVLKIPTLHEGFAKKCAMSFLLMCAAIPLGIMFTPSMIIAAPLATTAVLVFLVNTIPTLFSHVSTHFLGKRHPMKSLYLNNKLHRNEVKALFRNKSRLLNTGAQITGSLIKFKRKSRAYFGANQKPRGRYKTAPHMTHSLQDKCLQLGSSAPSKKVVLAKKAPAHRKK